MQASRIDLELPDYGYVSAEVLAGARCFAVTSSEGAELVGQRAGRRDFSGLAFPFFWPGEVRPREYRLRRNHPDLERGANGETKEKRKYLSPPGRGNIFYFHPDTPVEWLSDTSIPAIFVEGEKKALALWRFFKDRSEQVLVIALTGVWSWRAVVDKKRDAGGHITDEIRGAIADFDRIEWQGRAVRVLFDRNIHTNDSVKAARRGLTRELQQHGAVVEWVDLPADAPDSINGVDDYLDSPHYGEKALEAILAQKPDGGRETAIIEYSDWGMLERLWQYFPDQFLYVETWKKWANWNGAYWDFEHGVAALQAAIVATAQHIQNAEEESAPDIEALERFAKKYRSLNPATAVQKMAERDMRFRRTPDQFDRQPWLLNCANGTLDLQTGDLREPEQGDYLTRQLAVRWNPDAACPAWQRFIDDVFLQRRDLIDFIWRALGYSLTADTSEQVFFVCYGKGKNGKSTMLEVLKKIMGGYAKAAAASAFQEQIKGAGHSDNIAVLNGARLVIASESNEGARLDEALIKSFTGERALMVARKYESFWEMRLTGKIWLLVNHRPEIRGLDEGIWRRVIQIPFEYEVPEDKRIKKYEDVLFELEAEGILAWCVRGLWDYLERGSLGLPDCVEKANDDYKREMDIIGPFIESRCVISEPKATVNASDLYRAYCRFCEDSAEKTVTQHTFGRRLADHKFRKDRKTSGVIWKGIRLMTTMELNEAAERETDND